jgi:hypothetical protein
MKDLRELWKIGGLVKDGNGDGVPDGLNVNIKLEENCLPLGLIDFCSRLGFETTALSFNFFNSSNGEWNIEFSPFPNKTFCLLETDNKKVVFYYETVEKLSEFLKLLASSWPKGAENIEGTVQCISYKENSLFVHIDHEEKWIPVFKEQPINKENIKWDSLSDFWDGTGFASIKEPSPVREINVSFDFSGSITINLLKEACYLAARIGMFATKMYFPLTDKKLYSLLLQFRALDNEQAKIRFSREEQSIIFSGSLQQLPILVRYFSSAKHWSEGGDYTLWEKNMVQPSDEKEDILFSLEWEDIGEKERVLQICWELSKVYQSYTNLDIEIFISEPAEVRKELEKKLRKWFKNASSIKVRSSFKPGLHWIEEEIIPSLSVMKSHIDSIHIECRKEKRSQCLELPIRWIQELYPVDLLIEKHLNISASNVKFLLCDDLETTYVLKAFDKNGEVLYRDVLSVPTVEMDYIEKGKKIYPTTNCITIKENHTQLYRKIIPTDRERFYEFYQKEVLPLLWDKVKNYKDGQGFTMPLFDRIEIHVSMSEEERKLQIDEERVSSMEALHEDLYFNTLDYFVIKGKETIGEGFSAPGGVYPFLKAITGVRPKATIIAYKWRENQCLKWRTMELIFGSGSSPEKALIKDCLTGEEKIIDIKHKENHYQAIEALGITGETIRQWVPSFSYRGKPITVLEVFAEFKEEYYSPIKMAIFKPTIFIEAGHHANEVSSTPAILELIKEIATSHQCLLQKVNIVVLPLANPDGAMLHKKMTEDNSEWKHHAARYNAVGLEYSHVRYRETVFGEADAVPAIMKRWVPDVIIDDHGIPSHEWVQPFAGYNSPPRFTVSYWIPNALIYGIGRQLNPKEYPIHYRNLEKIIKNVEEKITSSDEIRKQNEYWLERYKKYGHQWLPNVFPLEQTGSLIFYKWPTEISRESTIAISRFPQWVSVDLITEVADETVYGETLERCKRAHKLFDIAVIETVSESKVSYQFCHSENYIEFKRQRPLIL